MRDAEQPGRKARRIVEFREILIRFQEHVLAKVHGIFAMGDQPIQVRKDAPFPARDEQVISLHVASSGFADEVAIFDFPEDQLWTPMLETRGGPKKSDSILKLLRHNTVMSTKVLMD